MYSVENENDAVFEALFNVPADYELVDKYHVIRLFNNVNT